MANYIDKIQLPNSTTYQMRDLEAFSLRSYTALTSSADLNNTTVMGNYYASNVNIARSLVNKPPDPNLHYGMLKVGYADGASPQWPYQFYADGYNGQEWYRLKLGASGNWTTWMQKNISQKNVGSTAHLEQYGTFVFSGNQGDFNGEDWVGIQIGDSVDKFQIIRAGGGGKQLAWRCNDTGGTNTANWSQWYYIPSTVSQATKNTMTVTDHVAIFT